MGISKSKVTLNLTLKTISNLNFIVFDFLLFVGLTEEFPSLTTFFDGEIISAKHPFLTRKWDADEEVDRKHWSKFADFATKYAKTFNTDSFDYTQLNSRDCVFMRWKGTRVKVRIERTRA